MNVAFDGIGRVAATLVVENGRIGAVCKMIHNGSVTACNSGDDFIGVVESYRGGYGSILVEGFTEVDYTGTAPGLGYVKLVADGYGGVKTNDNGRHILVVWVDEDKKTAVIKL